MSGPSQTEGSMRYEAIFAQGMSTTQKQTIQWVPRGGKVLELGCSAGYIGEILRQQKNCEVWGVEVDPQAAEEARGRGLDVRCGSLDDEAFLASLSGSYDMILANDVLEHLVDPDRALSRAIELLSPGGRLVISTPNIATWNVRSKLFFGGHFRYEEHGIMDRTHVHFFTWETFHEMLGRHRLRIDERAYETFEIPLTTHLLYRWPDEARRAIKGWPLPARAPIEGLESVARKLRERLGPRFGRALPNLCVPHIVVLVSPERPRLPNPPCRPSESASLPTTTRRARSSPSSPTTCASCARCATRSCSSASRTRAPPR